MGKNKGPTPNCSRIVALVSQFFDLALVSSIFLVEKKYNLAVECYLDVMEIISSRLIILAREKLGIKLGFYRISPLQNPFHPAHIGIPNKKRSSYFQTLKIPK